MPNLIKTKTVNTPNYFLLSRAGRFFYLCAVVRGVSFVLWFDFFSNAIDYSVGSVIIANSIVDFVVRIMSFLIAIASCNR